MGGMICSLLLTVLFAVNSIESKSLAIKPFEKTVQLFFLYNKSLARLSIAKHGRGEKTIIIKDEVRDYALDELRDRLLWLAENGSIFAKPMDDYKPSKLVLAPSNEAERIAYDLYTNKLYYADRQNNVMAVDLKYSNLSAYHWIIVNGQDKHLQFKKNFSIDRLSVHSEMGVMYVQYNYGDYSSLFSYYMDGSNPTVLKVQKDPIYYGVDSASKSFEFYKRETVIDEGQEYSLRSDGTSHKIYGPNKKHFQPYIYLDNFDVKDVKNLKLYRQSMNRLKHQRLTDPCGNDYTCEWSATCLLRASSPCTIRLDYSEMDKKHRRVLRQIPFDMYSQQPTLRPEPQPTQPDNPYLPVYLSIIGK